MDVSAMKAAVAAGVDGINGDYPRLGADAVGRPVERTLYELILAADSGKREARTAAILQLSRYSGFPLEQDFERWLSDPDATVSRAAAVALATARPRPGHRIVAWQGDEGARDTRHLRAIQTSGRPDAGLAAWAIAIIDSLYPKP